MLPDSGIKGILVVFRDQNQGFLKIPDGACLVWSCAVWSTFIVVVYNLVHVPDSDMCKAINARMYDSSSSSSDDD